MSKSKQTYMHGMGKKLYKDMTEHITGDVPIRNPIKIPFNAWSKKRLREERKFSTARTKIYGKTGDYFTFEGSKYIITHIVDLPTGMIINYLFMLEGADDPAELERVMNSIFRGKKLPKNLFLHMFIKYERFVADKL